MVPINILFLLESTEFYSNIKAGKLQWAVAEKKSHLIWYYCLSLRNKNFLQKSGKKLEENDELFLRHLKTEGLKYGQKKKQG